MTADNRAAVVESAVKAHAPSLLAYFIRRVEPQHDAADLLGETLLIVWRRTSSMPLDVAERRPWMFGIARNVLMHHYRRSRRQRAVTDRLRSILAVTPHVGFVDPEEHADLHQALRTLDVVDRDIIGLVHWDGFSLVEASRIVHMKESTVRSRYHRARATLRAQLQGDQADRSPLTVNPTPPEIPS